MIIFKLQEIFKPTNMKKILINILLFITIWPVFSQNIEDDYIDDFTKEHIVRTSWIGLFDGSYYENYFQMEKIDSSYCLNFRMTGGLETFMTFDKGEIFFLKLDNDSIIKLKNTEFEISGTGRAALTSLSAKKVGVKMSLWITTNQMDALLNNNILKIRIQSNKGYFDRIIDDKNYRIKNLIELVYKK
jgi:hypothetical protein